MSQENALYEIAQALNRLTILKAIELHASRIREANGDASYEAICNTSIHKAECDFFDNEQSAASVCDVVDDAELAIVSINDKTDITSPMIQQSYEEMFR